MVLKSYLKSYQRTVCYFHPDPLEKWVGDKCTICDEKLSTELEKNIKDDYWYCHKVLWEGVGFQNSGNKNPLSIFFQF